MSESWLKLIGTSKKPFQGRYENPHVDFSKNKRPRAIHPGDQIVLYAPGGSKRLFALAEVTSEVYENNEYEEYPYRVDISYEVNLPVSAGIHIEEVSTPKRNLLGAIQGSYLRLKPEEFELAASKLRQATQL
jgi:hypothetical protein